jgi:hypothetical protein
MGALLIRNAAAKIQFLFLPILWAPRFRFIFGVPALVVLPLWFVEQVASAHFEPDAPVAWWAHVGGFSFGMAAAGLLYLKNRKRLRARAPVLPRPRGAGSRDSSPGAAPRRDAALAAVRTPLAPTRPGGTVGFPRALRGGAWIRFAVVSPDAPGEVVITKGAEQVLRRALARVASGALAVDESIEVSEGPIELRIELRLVGAAPRVASVMAVAKKGESRMLRIELRPSGLVAELR